MSHNDHIFQGDEDDPHLKKYLKYMEKEKNRNFVRMTVWLTKKQKDSLLKVSKKRRVSCSQHVRDLIDGKSLTIIL